MTKKQNNRGRKMVFNEIFESDPMSVSVDVPEGPERSSSFGRSRNRGEDGGRSEGFFGSRFGGKRDEEQRKSNVFGSRRSDDLAGQDSAEETSQWRRNNNVKASNIWRRDSSDVAPNFRESEPYNWRRGTPEASSSSGNQWRRSDSTGPFRNSGESTQIDDIGRPKLNLLKKGEATSERKEINGSVNASTENNGLSGLDRYLATREKDKSFGDDNLSSQPRRRFGDNNSDFEREMTFRNKRSDRIREEPTNNIFGNNSRNSSFGSFLRNSSRQTSYENQEFGQARSRQGPSFFNAHLESSSGSREQSKLKEEVKISNVGPSSKDFVAPTSSLLSKVPNKVNNWADDDDEDAIAGPKIAPMSEAEIYSHVFRILKDFLVVFNHKDAIADLNIHLKNQSYQAELLTQLLTRSCNLDTRELKSVVSLIKELKMQNLISEDNLLNALNSVCHSLSNNVDGGSTKAFANITESGNKLRDFVLLLLSGGLLDASHLTIQIKNTLSIAMDETIDSKENAQVSEAVRTLSLMTFPGDNWVPVVNKIEAEKRPIVGVQLVESYLEKHPRICLEDDEGNWLDNNGLGPLLITMLADESVSENITLPVQTRLVYLIQNALSEGGFPRTHDGRSLFDRYLMKLFEMAIPSEAFYAWQDSRFADENKDLDDLSSKTQALIEGSQFIQALHQMEEENDGE